MIKTVTLSGKELKVDDLGGFNTIVHNLSDDAVYASKYPNIEAGADNVAEVPAGAAKLISTTNGTIYLLGTGKTELTGQDHDSVNFRQPSSSGGGGGTSDVTKAYVSVQDALNLEAAKTYTDDALDAAKENIEQVRSEMFDKISSNAVDISVLQTEKADRSEIPATLPANGGNADTVNGHTVNADVPENAMFTDTTYKTMTGATASAAGKSGLVPAPAKGAQEKYLRGDGTWQTPPDNNTTYSAMTGASASAAGAAGLVPAPAAGKQTSFLRGDGTWVVPTNTTYSNMTGATASAAGAAGLVPAPAAGKQTSFLRGDGTWVVPTNTTYSNMKAATASAAGAAGLVPAPAAGKQTSFLRGDGTWVVPTNTTYSNMTGATASATGKAGLVPAPPAGALKCYLSAVGSWGNPFAPTVIDTAGTDLNSYTTSGIYFFLQNQSPLNAPISGYNGWLLVSAYGSSVAVKQMWFRLGAVGTNDYETFVRTSINGTWSNWRRFATAPADVNPLQIVSIVQGSISGLTLSQETYYAPYQSGATKALVEVWKSVTTTGMEGSRSFYGARYMSGISSNMTKIDPSGVIITAYLSSSVGTDTTGRISFSSSNNSGTALYRITWLA